MADRTISVRIRAQIAEYQAAMAKVTKDTREFKNELGKAAKDGTGFTKQLGTGLLVAGGLGAVGFAKMAATGMDFQKQMSGVQAVSGATANEMQRLSDAALAAGASTKLAGVTASDAAAAQAELVKAGVSVDQVLGGALMGSLTLAAAGQLEFADAATIAAQAMNIFDLAGSEVTHVADVLAAAANKSAGDVGQFGDALRQGGLVASQTGMSLEETVGALAAFADNALIGSDAGTSLKTMLQRLTPQGAEAAGLMEELGFSAYDAAGNFVGLEGLAAELTDALGGMTVEQRNSAMATLFGSDAVRAANILYNEGADGIREYVEAVNDQGAAAAMAAIQNDNLSGDIEALGGALETVMIKGAGQADDVLRGLTQTVTTMVTGLTGLEGPMGGVAVGLGGVVTAAAGLGGAVLVLAPKIDQAKKALDDMGNVGKFASRNMGRFAGAMGVAGIAVAGLTWYLGKQAEKQAEAEEAALGYTDAIKEQGAAVGNLTDKLALEGVLEGELGEALRGVKADLSSFTDTLRESPGELIRLDDAVNTVALSMGGAENMADNLRGVLSDAGLSGAAFADELIRLAESGDLTAAQIDALISRIAFEAEAHRTGAREAANSAAATEATGTAADEAAPKITNYGEANEEAADPVKELEDAIKAVNSALTDQFDPLFAARDALLDNAEAHRKVDEAHWKVIAATEELAKATKEEGAESWAAKNAAYELKKAQLDLDQANRDVIDSAIEVATAQNELRAKVEAGVTSLDDAKAAMQKWVEQGLITQEQANKTADELGLVAWNAAVAGSQEVEIPVKLSGYDLLISQLRAIPGYGASIAISPAVRAEERAGAATGGYITQPGVAPIYRALGGPSGTDTVPAWLTPGEYVVRKQAVDAVGLSFMHDLNRATPARGGSYGAGMSIDYDRLVASAARAGGSPQVIVHKGDQIDENTVAALLARKLA